MRKLVVLILALVGLGLFAESADAAVIRARRVRRARVVVVQRPAVVVRAPFVAVAVGTVGSTFTDAFGRTFALDAFGRPVQIGGPILP